ncbi:MAG: nucleoside-diphosphate kinase [bacterium]
MLEKTLIIIKPDVYQDFGIEIANDLVDAGFEILESKEYIFDAETVKIFFLPQLKNISEHFINIIVGKPVNIMILEKENAISDLKKLVGKEDPRLAEKGTIRRLYGVDKDHNAVYCPQNIKEVDWDIKFFFSSDVI